MMRECAFAEVGAIIQTVLKRDNDIIQRMC